MNKCSRIEQKKHVKKLSCSSEVNWSEESKKEIELVGGGGGGGRGEGKTVWGANKNNV